ncbi:MAG TPA: dihydrolipoamide acetyltransferase family protein [Streptosporangiaceae bacterium]|nr:dihydrolipoamide acetyltransferase family protein [Streptosporangiaceae bacterium]
MTESVTTQRREFRLPDVGEGLTEADIVSWKVKPGDTVTVNQIIVDIETAKAVVELPCPYAGVVAALLVPEGQTVDVGTPIIAVDVPGPAGSGPAPVPPPAPAETGTAPAASPPGGAIDPAAIAAAGPRPSSEDLVPPVPPPAERQAVLVGYGVKAGATTRRPRKAPSTPDVSPAAGREAPAGSGSVADAVTPARANGTAGSHPSVLAKPPVRKLARELGVDLAGLAGTGPGGSITRGDVQQAADRPAAVSSAPAAAGLAEERIPIRGVRKHTAAAVAESARRAPHVTEFLQIDVDATVEAVRRLRELPEFTGVRVSPLLLVARALLVAVARHPMINSSWDEDAQEIVVKHYVNLGIAAATERGLIVPTIKGAGALSLPALARALAGLADTARAGRASPADLSGGTITITNVGVFGVDAGTPIITPPEAAILAFGQIKDAPWVVDGQLAVRKVTTLSLSFDHRIVDGDLGSAVLRDIGAMLHDPTVMLAWG